MAEKSGDFGLVGQSWEVSKIYLGSNSVKRYNGVLENSSMRTLSTFVKSSETIGLGIDQDTKADDRLAKYNVTKMIPTKNLGEFDDTQNVYVITDASGHDIGILTMVNGQMEFRLSPKIAEANKKIIEGFPEHQRKEIAEKYGLDSQNLSSKEIDFKTVVEKLSKGETVSIISKEQVKVECREEIQKANREKLEKYGNGYEIEDISSEEKQKEAEEKLEEQQKVVEAIPEDMRAEVVQKCKEEGIEIKAVLVVTSPELLMKSIDNRETQITKDGGPVVLIQAAHDGADSLGDDIYTFQDGSELQHAEQNDDELTSIMEQHRDEGTIIDIDNNRAIMIEQKILAEVQEAEQKIKEQQLKIEEAEAEIENLNDYEFNDPEDREQAISALQLEISDAQQEIENIGRELSHEIDVIRDNSKEKGDDTQGDSGVERTLFDDHDPMNQYGRRL